MRELRQKRGLTQMELAERLGLPQARVSELERGMRAPNLVAMLRLAVALECKVADVTPAVPGCAFDARNGFACSESRWRRRRPGGTENGFNHPVNDSAGLPRLSQAHPARLRRSGRCVAPFGTPPLPLRARSALPGHACRHRAFWQA